MKRPRAALAGAVLGLVALAAGWLVMGRRPPAPAVRLATPPSSTAPGPASSVAAPGTSVGGPALPSAAAVKAPARAPASRPLQPGEINLCGVGIVQGEPVAEPGQPPRIDLPKAIEDELQRQIEQQGIPALARAAPGIDPAVALLQRRTGDLVRVALRERSPRSVLWAFQACQSRAADPDCALLPQRLWVELEPDNAYAWLMLMSADPSTQADAMYRMTLARRFEERVGSLVGSVDAALPAGTPTHLRANLLVYAMGIEAALPMPSFAVLVKACDPAQVADANRRQQCNAIAELLAEQSQTLISRRIGARMGENLGWPTERTATLRGRVDEALARAARNFDEATRLPPYGCAQAEALARPIRDIGRLGEWRALTQPPR